MISQSDVVVIGAGLSGLQSALLVQKAGFSCLVVEAGDRVGGKTLSLPSTTQGSTLDANSGFASAGVVDVGAAWINDTNQSHMWALAKKYGLKTEAQRAEGKIIHEDKEGEVKVLGYGESPQDKTTSKAIVDFFYFFDRTYKELAEESFSGSRSKEFDGMTLEQFCQKYSDSESVVETMDGLAVAFVGANVGEMSALYFLRYVYSGTGLKNMMSDKKDGGQYLRIHTGTQSFSKYMASELKPGSLFLSTPVTKVEQLSEGSCLVRSSTDATFTCKKVIVSIPTTLYPSISFTPDLPPAKKLLGDSTVLGYYSKMILIFSSPWWQTHNLSGAFQSSLGPVSFTFDTCIPSLNQYSISCFLVGDRGRQWSKQSKIARQKEVLEQFVRLFQAAMGSSKVPEPINIVEYEWAKQSWFWGAPSPIMPTAVLTSEAGEVIKTPVGNVHFVGTETADVWEGYMEGAVRSGERGAAEVVEDLKGGESI